MSDTRSPAISALICTLLIRTTLAWTFVVGLSWGLLGAWLAALADQLCRAIFLSHCIQGHARTGALGRYGSTIRESSLFQTFKNQIETGGRPNRAPASFPRPSSLEEAANDVASAALEVFDGERAIVVLRDTLGGVVPVTLGPSSTEVPDERTAELVSATIGSNEPRLVPRADTTMMLVLPLPASDMPAGTVVVHPINPENPECTIGLARLFGSQVSVAIEHLLPADEVVRA